jgi:retinol-binding protein 3
MKLRNLATSFLFAFIATKSVCQFTMKYEPVPITTQDTKTIVEQLATVMENGYVETDKGHSVKAMLTANLQSKKYKSIKTADELVSTLIKEVQSIIQDKHFNILFVPNGTSGFSWTNENQETSEEEIEKAEKENFERHRRLNFGLPKIEVLEGNIGYLKVAWFNSPNEWFKNPLADAFSFLKYTDALIVDVRNNPGGQEETVSQLASYFFGENEKILLTTSHQKLKGEVISFYTDPNVINKYLDKKVYLLTSTSTGSGGEMITYHFKHFQKGTIIGENTVGAGNGFSTVKIGGDHLGNIMVMVPDTFTEHAVTKTNWEKVGVAPDISVPAEEALFVAYSSALKYLEEKTDDENKRKVYKQLITSAEFKHQMKDTKLPFDLQEYIGQYDIRTVSREGDVLFFQRENGPKIRLQNVGVDMFELDIAMTPKPIIRFKRENNKVVALIMNGPSGDLEIPRN